MAFVTYILLSTLLAGFRGAFRPELLGLTATTAFAVVIFEILGLKLGCYLLSISNDSQLFDLVAYSGYKFVGIIITILFGEIANRGFGAGSWVGWAVFVYTFLALAFFLVRESACFRKGSRANVLSYDRSNTCSCPSTLQITLLLGGHSEIDEHSSYLSTHTSYSWRLCGSYHGSRFIRKGKKTSPTRHEAVRNRPLVKDAGNMYSNIVIPSVQRIQRLQWASQTSPRVIRFPSISGIVKRTRSLKYH